MDDSDIFSPTPRKEISASLDATNEIELDDDDGDSIKKETVAAAGLSPSSSLDQPFALSNGNSSSASINIKPAIVTSNINNNINPTTTSPSSPPITTTISTPSVQKAVIINYYHLLINIKLFLFQNSVIDDDDEDRDKFIEILISDPTKMGDGMSAYMTYKVTTKV